ncbi:C69 family dipeptidase [Bifidobacterium sp. 64T4]|uniref:C69 family dipeptidase n=1 Tax=Bifidobacterium pongonis TaxID=2834432 RepID=UPI001C591825|nr:C69 family dipeptidase [Bifidobacterium pongonis]MBW3093766.1 C69 family dipeptidase [Bifidobacterium pongonis]MBW3093945.1 C69 family dipeptidase [Bifidobacterium pongonis]
MSCTTILVGKKASYDGSTIIARDDDSGSGRYDPKRFIAVAPEDQPRHYRSVLSHVEIDLPDNPCRYSIVPNVLPNRGVLAEAGVNEHNVAMSATETIAVNERVLAADPMVELQEDGTPGGIGEEDIITLVLPYVATAREGVSRLGRMLERYGTYEANGVIISDVDEIWYVETIGGHHWIARRVPDDCYATIPNQLGIDDFDCNDAFGEQREYLCSSDLREFIAEHHLSRTVNPSGASLDRFNPRTVFGTATTKDHIYNTPRAWYMQRHLNPSEDWDSPAARYTPSSDDIPWCRVPENTVTIEDVDFLMSAHFEGTPYDPYGTLGTPESRHRYRPIGINRTGHMVAMQIRPYAPAESRSIMWISYGSGPFTAATPFYANVNDTPAYLRDTTPEVSTDNLYWTNRLIAALADAHWYETNNAIEGFAENARVFGHRLVERTDAAFGGETTGDAAAVRRRLEASNTEMAEYLRKHATTLLNDVLYTSSNLMRNGFAMSDRWN